MCVVVCCLLVVSCSSCGVSCCSWMDVCCVMRGDIAVCCLLFVVPRVLFVACGCMLFVI